jgi:hypothetical protein
MTGVPRQHELDIASGSASRCIAHFRGFERERGAGHGGRHGAAGGGHARQSRAPGTRTYSPDSIRALYDRRRRGKISDAEWAKIEPDIFAAQHDWRLLAPPYFTK